MHVNKKNNKDSRSGVSTLWNQFVAFISESDIVAIVAISVFFMLYVKFAHEPLMDFTLRLIF